MKPNKPLGQKSYGSIPHLPNSRMREGDHHCHEGQARIATLKKRDKHDLIIVQEKLDGSNVGVCKLNGQIIALSRSGYEAMTSPYKQHIMFAEWVEKNKSRFDGILFEGERICGEWLVQAHGTRYNLPHEPFVAFDLITKNKRATYKEFMGRITEYDFTAPQTLSIGEPLSIEVMLELIKCSAHGAIDEVEGAIWRVERKFEVDYLVKYVKPHKVDGKFLPEFNNGETVWNEFLSKPG